MAASLAQLTRTSPSKPQVGLRGQATPERQHFPRSGAVQNGDAMPKLSLFELVNDGSNPGAN